MKSGLPPSADWAGLTAVNALVPSCSYSLKNHAGVATSLCGQPPVCLSSCSRG